MMTKVDARAMLSTWLRELSGELGIDELILDAEDACTFSHQNVSNLTIAMVEGDEPLVQFYTPILLVPERDRLKFLRTLLEFNLLGMKTNGTTLSLDLEGKSVVLSYSNPIELLDHTAFNNLMRNIIATVIDVKHRLQGIETDENQQNWIRTHPEFLA